MSGEYRSSTETRRGYIAGATGIKEIEYAMVDGKGIFEGDIIIGTEEGILAAEQEGQRSIEAGEELAELPGRPKRGIVLEGCIITGASYRWAKGVIPYVIDAGLTNRARVTNAINHWHRNTDLRFVARNTQRDYMRFVSGSGCASYVGRNGGRQDIELATGCDLGNTIHEIGHTVGLWHEQSREDRDDFVTVHLENVDADAVHNFNQHITDGDDVGPYDYGSVMHYPRDAFSKNGLDTITPPAGVSIGQRDGLSNGDVAAVDFMYNTRPGNATVNRINADGRIGERVERFHWTEGWTHVAPYIVNGKTFLFLLKSFGFGSDGKNVHLHRPAADGGVGNAIGGYQWTQGWTSAAFYTCGGANYLLLLKKSGFASDRNNVHIHRVNNDGTIGAQIDGYDWTQGWSLAQPYMVGGAPYLLLLKEYGFAADGNNVHLHRINNDGKVGDMIAGYRWTEGWSNAAFCQAGGSLYLFLLKKAGFAADGKNAHVHRMNADGTVGDQVAAYGWTEGWTHCLPYIVGGRQYLFLMKEYGFASDGNNVHIHQIAADGSIGAQVQSFQLTQGWTAAAAYPRDGNMYLIMVRAASE